MSNARDDYELADVEFTWGSKIERGGTNRDMQLYESFTYDGIKYFLYDSVYLFEEGQPEPYIGKLIQIYELSNKARKVKLLWFFRPSDISNYLGGVKVLENELFLATGYGKGLMNVNPLDRSRWVKASNVPWDEQLKEAHDQGTLVLLQNLDPSYTSREIENIVWHGFEYGCTAKMVPHTALSSSHSGQAFAIFKTSEAANKIVRKLGDECLMLPNGRPLVGSRGFVCFPGKQSLFPGHIVIDKLRHKMSRDLREAVSTFHFSQPNNIEHDLALDWCVLQKRSSLLWENLYKEQSREIEKLKAMLRSK